MLHIHSHGAAGLLHNSTYGEGDLKPKAAQRQLSTALDNLSTKDEVSLGAISTATQDSVEASPAARFTPEGLLDLRSPKQQDSVSIREIINGSPAPKPQPKVQQNAVTIRDIINGANPK